MLDIKAMNLVKPLVMYQVGSDGQKYGMQAHNFIAHIAPHQSMTVDDYVAGLHCEEQPTRVAEVSRHIHGLYGIMEEKIRMAGGFVNQKFWDHFRTPIIRQSFEAYELKARAVLDEMLQSTTDETLRDSFMEGLEVLDRFSNKLSGGGSVSAKIDLPGFYTSMQEYVTCSASSLGLESSVSSKVFEKEAQTTFKPWVSK